MSATYIGMPAPSCPHSRMQQSDLQAISVGRSQDLPAAVGDSAGLAVAEGAAAATAAASLSSYSAVHEKQLRSRQKAAQLPPTNINHPIYSPFVYAGRFSVSALTRDPSAAARSSSWPGSCCDSPRASFPSDTGSSWSDGAQHQDVRYDSFARSAEQLRSTDPAACSPLARHRSTTTAAAGSMSLRPAASYTWGAAEGAHTHLHPQMTNSSLSSKRRFSSDEQLVSPGSAAKNLQVAELETQQRAPVLPHTDLLHRNELYTEIIAGEAPCALHLAAGVASWDSEAEAQRSANRANEGEAAAAAAAGTHMAAELNTVQRRHSVSPRRAVFERTFSSASSTYPHLSMLQTGATLSLSSATAAQSPWHSEPAASTQPLTTMLGGYSGRGVGAAALRMQGVRPSLRLAQSPPTNVCPGHATEQQTAQFRPWRLPVRSHSDSSTFTPLEAVSAAAAAAAAAAPHAVSAPTSLPAHQGTLPSPQTVQLASSSANLSPLSQFGHSLPHAALTHTGRSTERALHNPHAAATLGSEFAARSRHRIRPVRLKEEPAREMLHQRGAHRREVSSAWSDGRAARRGSAGLTHGPPLPEASQQARDDSEGSQHWWTQHKVVNSDSIRRRTAAAGVPMTLPPASAAAAAEPSRPPNVRRVSEYVRGLPSMFRTRTRVLSLNGCVPEVNASIETDADPDESGPPVFLIAQDSGSDQDVNW